MPKYQVKSPYLSIYISRLFCCGNFCICNWCI